MRSLQLELIETRILYMDTQLSLASAETAASTSLDTAEVPIRPGFACNHCSKAKVRRALLDAFGEQHTHLRSILQRKCSGTDGTVACM